jgi:ferric-dicitrate binding protein FerR (iron transport regulator)
VSDYLFDKEGEPDPEVARLEQLLAPVAYRGAPPRLPQRRTRRTFVVVAAAMTAMAAAIVALLIAKPWRPAPSWAATVREGTATRDGQPIAGATRLPVGAWLETQSGRAQLTVADIGVVELAPATRARIVVTGAQRHELELARGTLVARIDAPPRRFAVRTPRAVVTDLGCAFELTVDESGRGRLVVTAGKVAVGSSEVPEVVVVAGARVELTARGPGAPYTPRAESLSRPAQPAIVPHAAAAPEPPIALQPSIAPQSPIAPPAVSHPGKPAHPPAHSTKAPSGPRRPSKAPPAVAAPPQQAPPPSKPAKVEHDPLKELQRSVE